MKSFAHYHRKNATAFTLHWEQSCTCSIFKFVYFNGKSFRSVILPRPESEITICTTTVYSRDFPRHLISFTMKLHVREERERKRARTHSSEQSVGTKTIL